MTAAILTAWFHYIAFMLMAGGIVAELYVLKLVPTLESIRLGARIDRVYGIGAALVLVTGLSRIPLPHGGKGFDFYLHNGAFHGALTAFILAALISIVPTLRFIKWKRAALQSGNLPSPQEWGGLRKFVHIQLALMAVIALLMPVMARGGF